MPQPLVGDHVNAANEDQDPTTLPRLPGQSFAIEQRVRKKKNKRRLVQFVLEASRLLETVAGAFLE